MYRCYCPEEGAEQSKNVWCLVTGWNSLFEYETAYVVYEQNVYDVDAQIYCFYIKRLFVYPIFCLRDES
jgi:hypothetical protein